MTLVELLIVVAAIGDAGGGLLPRLRPEIDRTRVREAARSIQLTLSAARNQAMATSRSCGVMIERLPAVPGCSMSISQVETPPAYGGDTANATAKVVANSPAGGLCPMHDHPLARPPAFRFIRATRSRSDIKGSGSPWSTQNAINSATAQSPTRPTLTGYVDTSHGEIPAWTVQPITGPYKIMRWPNKSATDALQLPSPSCIDLTYSGLYDPTNPTWPSSTPAGDDHVLAQRLGRSDNVTSASGAYAGSGHRADLPAGGKHRRGDRGPRAISRSSTISGLRSIPARA